MVYVRHRQDFLFQIGKELGFLLYQDERIDVLLDACKWWDFPFDQEKEEGCPLCD